MNATTIKYQKLAIKHDAIFVNARTKLLGKIPRVLIKMPIGEWTKKHTILTWSPEEKKQLIKIKINRHIKAPLYVDRKFIGRDFYIRANPGTWIVADIEVVKKEDYYRGTTTLNLNFFLSNKQKKPLYQLKIGTPKEFLIKFKIPGTNKFIAFKEI